jgi:hypothetical protein
MKDKQTGHEAHAVRSSMGLADNLKDEQAGKESDGAREDPWREIVDDDEEEAGGEGEGVEGNGVLVIRLGKGEVWGGVGGARVR